MTRISYLNEGGIKGELWDPITGCSGKGCATKETCWAKGMMNRFPNFHGYRLAKPGWGTAIPFEEIRFHPDRLDQPLHWKKPRRVGVCFLGDLFS